MIKALVCILIISFSIAIIAGFVWLICWAFGFAWSWKLSIGVWAIIELLSMVFKQKENK